MATIIKRVGRDGHVTWQAKIRRKGWPAATGTFDRRADAERWAAESERDLRRGVVSNIRGAHDMTLAEALQRYVRDISSRKKSRKNEAKIAKVFTESGYAGRALTNIRPADVASWRDGRLNHGLSAYTVRNELAMLSHVYTVAGREWGFEGLPNPVMAIDRPRAPRGRARRLNPGEEKRLMTSARAGQPWLPPAIGFALETAMRIGEICALAWADIDFKARTALLHDTKSGDQRLVPLSRNAIATLKDVPSYASRNREGKVFVVVAARMSHEFSECATRAKLEDLRFHDLRHEATSRLFEKGLSDMQVATITGHKTLAMLQRYAHLRARQLVKLLD